MLRRGQRLGKYRLERRLGRGAFSHVWKARDMVERRDVALKIVTPAIVKSHDKRELEKEARIAAHLSHPNVVGVRNADWISGHFVLVIDLAERSLDQASGVRRSGERALRVVRDVAAGLAYAHSQRLMHRDLKPENILLFRDGRAALADFGVSRFASPYVRRFTDAGTLGYLAPEQAYGRPELSSDVFSLGLIACELLTGVLPVWPFDWPPEPKRRFLAKVPEPLRPVLQKASQFDPARRYRDGVELHRALERAFARIERPRPPRRRRRAAPAPSPLKVQAELFRKRHGAGLGMRYTCHRCDGPIAEAFGFCPWCGSADNSFREVTSLPVVCPECERGVRREWKACPWCFAGRFEGSGRRLRDDPVATRRCTRKGCEGQLRPFMRYCPLCKQKVVRPWTHPELRERCTRCRGPVSREFWHYCAWCGRRDRGAARYKRR